MAGGPRDGISGIPGRVWLAALPLATGAGLVIHVLSGLSLGLAVVASFGLAFVLGVLVWRRLPAARREIVRRRVVVGAGAGLLGTFAYDATRLLIVSLVPMSFWPFDTLTLFGTLLAGAAASPASAFAIGTAYHLANGTCFGIAYALIVRRPSVLTGIAWAALLELLMVSIYPGWLHLRALDEFLTVSVLGHAAYGLVLGGLAGLALRRLDARHPRRFEPIVPGRPR
jgi:hypothetical protein